MSRLLGVRPKCRVTTVQARVAGLGAQHDVSRQPDQRALHKFTLLEIELSRAC